MGKEEGRDNREGSYMGYLCFLPYLLPRHGYTNKNIGSKDDRS